MIDSQVGEPTAEVGVTLDWFEELRSLAPGGRRAWSRRPAGRGRAT